MGKTEKKNGIPRSSPAADLDPLGNCAFCFVLQISGAFNIFSSLYTVPVSYPKEKMCVKNGAEFSKSNLLNIRTKSTPVKKNSWAKKKNRQRKGFKRNDQISFFPEFPKPSFPVSLLLIRESRQSVYFPGGKRSLDPFKPQFSQTIRR